MDNTHEDLATYERTEVIEIPDISQVTKYIPADPIQNVVSCSLSKMMGDNHWYTIIEGLNDQISWSNDTTGPTVYTATITPGAYTNPELGVELSNLMTTTDTTGWSVNYSEITGRYTFDPVSASTLLWNTGAANAAGRSVGGTVGFLAVDGPSTAAATTGAQPSTLIRPYKIIQSKVLSGGRRWGVQGTSGATSRRREIGFIIPMQGDREKPYYYEDIAGYPLGSDNTFSYQGDRTFEEIDISILDTADLDNLYTHNEGLLTLILTFQCLRRFK